MRFPPTPRSSDFPPPQDAPGARTSESPIDHALTLLLAGEIDASMRWAAAVLERSPSPGALLVTCRLLDQMGRTRAAVEGLKLVVQQAVDLGDLPLAVAAIDDLRALGVDVGEHVDAVASAFCRGSSRLHRGDPPPGPPMLPGADFVQPLSPFLAGPALASKATQIVHDARHRYEEALGGELPQVVPLPLFSSLSKGALCDVLEEFHAVTLPAGHPVIVEDDECSEAYVVVRGEVEISRRAAHGDNKFTLALARLRGGAFFGEMALLSLMPSPASATTTRPSILLSAKREALVAVAANRPEIAGQLAAHCRRTSLANLGWTSQVVAAVPPVERATLVERLEMRVFEKGDLLVRSGEESPGLHLIVSGEIAIVAREWGERVLLADLGAGDTVGEMELVLCRQPFADAVATRPTATLFLSRDEYSSLIQDHPAILHGLYAIAVQRQAETSFALKSGSAVVADDWLLDAAAQDGGDRPARTQTPAASAPPAAPDLRAEVAAPAAPPPTAAPPPSAPPALPAAVSPQAAEVTTLRPAQVQPAPRRTLPPPPLRQTTSGPTSLTPTAASVRAASLAAEPRRPTWASMGAVTTLAAAAACVATVLALRGPEPAGAARGAAARPPAAEVDSLSIAPGNAPSEAPSQPVPAVAAPTPAASVAPSAVAAKATAAGNAQRTATAAPLPVRAQAAVAAPAQASAPTPAPASTVKTVAISSPASAPRRPAPQAPARVESAPASAPASPDDEFGGRQ